jgi:hypothetical protein
MIVTERRLDNLKKSLKILKVLDARSRNLFIDQMKNETIHLLIKCIQLIIKTGSHLTPSQLNDIRSQANNIRQLASAKTLTSKKKILQKGGFLGAILPSLIRLAVPALLGAILPRRR